MVIPPNNEWISEYQKRFLIKLSLLGQQKAIENNISFYQEISARGRKNAAGTPPAAGVPVEVGEEVVVVGQDGLKLIVRKVEPKGIK